MLWIHLSNSENWSAYVYIYIRVFYTKTYIYIYIRIYVFDTNIYKKYIYILNIHVGLSPFPVMVTKGRFPPPTTTTHPWDWNSHPLQLTGQGSNKRLMWDVLQAILVGWPCCGMNQLATTKTLVRLVGERIAQTTPYTKMFREAERGGDITCFFLLVGVEEMSDFNIFLIKGLNILDIDSWCPICHIPLIENKGLYRENGSASNPLRPAILLDLGCQEGSRGLTLMIKVDFFAWLIAWARPFHKVAWDYYDMCT